MIQIIPLISIPSLTESFWQTISVPTSEFSIRNAFRELMEFPRSYSDFFNSHYFLHDQQVDAFETIRLHVLGEKEFPNVVIGKNDWLYYTGEDNIRDYECTSPFTKKELISLVERLQGWDEQLRGMGIDFYVLIAPNKESIYPQYLPDDIHSG